MPFNALILNFPAGFVGAIVKLFDWVEFGLVLFPHNLVSDIFLDCNLFDFKSTVQIFVNSIETILFLVEAWELFNLLVVNDLIFFYETRTQKFNIFYCMLKIILEFMFFFDDDIEFVMLVSCGLLLDVSDIWNNPLIPNSFVISKGNVIDSTLTIFFLYLVKNRIAHFGW